MKGESKVRPKVRATAVLIEDGCLLLVRQRIPQLLPRQWSLPGGTLETGETLGECVIRETKEETGLDVVVGKLLYVCDRIDDDQHVVHVTFAVRRVGGSLGVGAEPESVANPITGVEMVPLESLTNYGFSKRFSELMLKGFPQCGSYRGSVASIGL